jgi:hypothetical protein
LIVGIDGIDYNLWEKFMTVEDYDVYPCYSDYPWTLPGWTSIYTGQPWTFLPLNMTDWWTWWQMGAFELIRVPMFWDILNQNGYSVELFNLPTTYPPKPVDGYFISGFPIMTLDQGVPDDYTYPRNIKDQLPKDFVHRSDMVYYSAGDLNLDAWVQYIKGTVGRRNIVTYMAEDSYYIWNEFMKLHKTETDMAFVQFSILDRLGHISPRYMKAGYKLTSDLVQKMERDLQPDNVIVIGDHGMYYNPEYGQMWHTYFTAFGCKGKDDITPSNNLKNVCNSVLGLWDLKMPHEIQGHDDVLRAQFYKDKIAYMDKNQAFGGS